MLPFSWVVAEEKPSLSSYEKQPSLNSYYVGDWFGETSQGHPIRLKIKDIDGKIVVTQLAYKMKLKGLSLGWEKTVDRLKPQNISAVVGFYDFKFKGKVEFNKIELTGTFQNASLLEGTLKEINIFPVNIVTAIGEVKYRARKRVLD